MNEIFREFTVERSCLCKSCGYSGGVTFWQCPNCGSTNVRVSEVWDGKDNQAT
jgi:lipopolysaccharide biosynthesis regulator YciM